MDAELEFWLFTMKTSMTVSARTRRWVDLDPLAGSAGIIPSARHRRSNRYTVACKPGRGSSDGCLDRRKMTAVPTLLRRVDPETRHA
jgi:hypothetical protein